VAETKFLIRIQRDLGVSLSATPDLDEGLRLCLSAAMRAAGADGGGIYLRDTGTGDLRIAIHQGLSPAFVTAVSFFPSDSPNARMIAEGKSRYVMHSEIPLTLVEADERLRALAAMPVLSQGQVIACLNIASKTDDDFREPQRIALETIATQIGGAIRRLQLETEHRAKDEALLRSQQELRALATRLAQNSEHERRSIASELHDGVTQTLAGLRFSLASVTRALPASTDSPIRDQLLDASNSLGDVLSQIRHLILGLRPPMLEHFGPVAAVQYHAAMFQEQTGIAVDVSGDETSVEVSSDVCLVLFRVAQEALSNVAKHAEAEHVTVAINATAGAVTMHISDDGCGFEPDRIVENANGEHLGVITMHERARSVGGIVQIDSEFNKGTQITLTVPTTVPDE